MTKKEIAEIIAEKAAEYGFEMEAYSWGWQTCWTNSSYIRVEIIEGCLHDRETGIFNIPVSAAASICRMGGSDTPEELLKAADEIVRGAKFAAEINEMKLEYEKYIE